MTNPIDSAFGTFRDRTDQAKGRVTRDTMLVVVHKLAMCADRRWQRTPGFRQLGQGVRGVQLQDDITFKAS